MSLLYAKIRLSEWGRWSRDKSLGYPRVSAGFSNAGRGQEVLAQWPPHIEIVDVIVRQMEVDPRRILIVAYTQYGTGREKAMRLCRPYSTYCRILKDGQEHVGIELEYAETYGGNCRVGQNVAYGS